MSKVNLLLLQIPLGHVVQGVVGKGHVRIDLLPQKVTEVKGDATRKHRVELGALDDSQLVQWKPLPTTLGLLTIKNGHRSSPFHDVLHVLVLPSGHHVAPHLVKPIPQGGRTHATHDVGPVKPVAVEGDHNVRVVVDKDVTKG